MGDLGKLLIEGSGKDTREVANRVVSGIMLIAILILCFATSVFPLPGRDGAPNLNNNEELLAVLMIYGLIFFILVGIYTSFNIAIVYNKANIKVHVNGVSGKSLPKLFVFNPNHSDFSFTYDQISSVAVQGKKVVINAYGVFYKIHVNNAFDIQQAINRQKTQKTRNEE